MKTLANALLLALVFACLAGMGAMFYLRSRQDGFSARAQPSAPEAALARLARTLAVPRAEKERVNLIANSPEVMHEAMAHYADHCAVCHGNDGSGDTMLGRGMYPKPPDMRLTATQSRTDGELFAIIENGVRLSGMPAFGSPGDDGTDSWKLVRFLRHLPQLTPDELAEMGHLNPKSPDELQEEKEEEEFLNGGGAAPTPKK